jgi:CRP/FNR family transcriptional regulator
MQLYAGELQKAEMRMRDLALMEVKGRVAQTLLELHQVFGINREKYIAVAVTRQDIAAYSGTTYETVFKILKTFEKTKTISTAGKSIRVNDLVKLGKIVSTAK